MVSERYRCAIYSDLEDEEDEADFAYESDEEEFSDPKRKEYDSVSEVVEISNCDFIVGSFGQESTLDIVHAIPIKTVKPEIEGCTVKIGQITCSFNTIESETCDDAFSFLDPETKTEDKCAFYELKSERVMQVPNHSLYSKNLLPSSNLFRRSCLEWGNLSLPIVVSSPATIVEYIDFDFAKPSELSIFTFDPSGVSKDTVYDVSDFIAVFHRQQPSDLPYAAARHRNFIFDRGKPPLVTDQIRPFSYPSSTDLIFAKPILVFDLGGSLAVSISTVVVFAFCCGVRILFCFWLATIQSSRMFAFLFCFRNLIERENEERDEVK